jgi:DNA-binding NtrC family response regulator
VRSQPSKGSTFIMYLPQATGVSKTEDAAPSEAEASTPVGKGHVLVVEDNHIVGEFAAQLLEELGYRTTWAPNAQAALAALDEKRDSFDLVFTDVVMPGTSGVELAEELRRRRPGLPVVLTSGYSHVLAERGTHGFELLKKPYSVEALSRVLRRASDKSYTAPF